MSEGKIASAVSDGSYDCFWCGQKIWSGHGCVSLKIKAKVRVPIAGAITVNAEEFAHEECADQIAMLSHRAADEARQMTKRRQR